MNCQVTLLPEKRQGSALAGTALREALARLDMEVLAPCGGEGTCGKCRVQVDGPGLESPGPAERALLSAEQLREGIRLSCQARICGSVQATVPAASRPAPMRILPGGVDRKIRIEPAVCKQAIHLQPQTLCEPYARLEHLRRSGNLRADLRAVTELLPQLPQLLDGTEAEITAVIREDQLLALEPGNTSERCFGLALDLGTTTVVAALIDLNTGRQLGYASTVNQQASEGHDVIARINTTIEEADGLQKLQAAARASLDRAITQVLAREQVDPQEVYEATLVGNTTMVHLYLGISPASLGHLPYVGMVADAVDMPASQLDLHLHPSARIYILPAIAGFVGADTVAAALAASFDEDDGRIRIIADIGTNCELVLRRDERLLVTSTPAGPAFEGARIACGMYAGPGAIEAVHLDGDVHCKVIGRQEPRGLCGSGLVDAGAELLANGIIDETGRLLEPEELGEQVSEALKRRLVPREDGLSFVLAESVALTQRDIRELQLAKASIRTAVDLLLEKAELAAADIDEFVLAGGFGNYIDKANAMRLGLIPELPPEKIRFIGNGALVGARLALLSRTLRQRGVQIAQRAEHLQLAGTPDFQDRFTEALLFT